MPFFLHGCTECEYEWEDLFDHWTASVPDECPACHKKDCIKRLMSLTARGVVPLSGKELVNNIRSAATTNQSRKEITKSENSLANFVGESKYQANIKSIEKNK